jgi:thioester reductase-like protein
MSYFVTGATGFIGRHLVEELLRNRDGDINVLVRATSVARLDALIERWDAAVPGAGARARIRPVTGDLQEPRLGVSDADVTRLRGTVGHFFHLAAIYDMTASDEANQRLNVDGTRNAVALTNALGAGRLHHVSSIAAAGAYEGLFSEDMFDEGQTLPSPYHRTKFESERIAREESAVPWRVYRPAVVVGHSLTGEMDKVDGPYYFFNALRVLARRLPSWLPLIGPDPGDTNIVPVDFVVAALDHIAHEPGFDGRAFHLTSPERQSATDALNTFAVAAGAPRVAVRVRGRVPKRAEGALARLGIPMSVAEQAGFPTQFDTTQTARALAGTGIAVPALESYAARLWDYWARNLSGAAPVNA